MDQDGRAVIAEKMFQVKAIGEVLASTHEAGGCSFSDDAISSLGGLLEGLAQEVIEMVGKLPKPQEAAGGAA